MAERTWQSTSETTPTPSNIAWNYVFPLSYNLAFKSELSDLRLFISTVTCHKVRIDYIYLDFCPIPLNHHDVSCHMPFENPAHYKLDLFPYYLFEGRALKKILKIHTILIHLIPALENNLGPFQEDGEFIAFLPHHFIPCGKRSTMFSIPTKKRSNGAYLLVERMCFLNCILVYHLGHCIIFLHFLHFCPSVV